MTAEELEVAARSLYERNPVVKPEWRQLGEATKDVWREQARDPAAAQAARLQRVRQAVQAMQTELELRKCASSKSNS